MEKLKELLAQFSFTGSDQTAVLSLFHPLSLRKGDFFLKEGQISRTIAWVQTGLLQYFYNRDGDEITTYVAGADAFAASLTSFLQQKPAFENIRAIADTELWVIDKNSVDALRRANAAFAEFYLQLLEHQIVCIDESRFNLITLNAEQRYQKMLAEEPALLHQIPLQYLASILGVTPRHLSRIRSHK